MSSETPSSHVTSRNQKFAKKLKTKITKEIASSHNPFLVDEMRIHGYEHFELIEKRSFTDIIFLLHRGELPNENEKKIFEALCCAFINPGPRHPATQASIIAGVGKTNTVSILPIALSIYGGEFEGAANVEKCIRVFRKNKRKTPSEILEEYKSEGKVEGFGKIYGDVDSYGQKLLKYFEDKFDEPILSWVVSVNKILLPEGLGILKYGIFSALLADLGFQPRSGSLILQLIAAPGLSAHGVEYANKPTTDYYFEDDENYIYDGIL